MVLWSHTRWGFFTYSKYFTSGKFRKAPYCVISYTKTNHISIFLSQCNFKKDLLELNLIAIVVPNWRLKQSMPAILSLNLSCGLKFHQLINAAWYCSSCFYCQCPKRMCVYIETWNLPLRLISLLLTKEFYFRK